MLIGVLSLLVVMAVWYSSSEFRARKESKAREIQALSTEELGELVLSDVCQALEITEKDLNRSFCSELGIPKGKVVAAFEDLGIDYQLPISGDDADTLHTLSEVLTHILKNREG